MTTLRVRLSELSGDVQATFQTMSRPIARAATATMQAAGELLKAEVRASIAAGGLSKKWQNAWRVRTFPERGVSIDAAAYGKHNIAYAEIFDRGGQITGRPLLWLPFAGVPKVGRERQARPRDLANMGIKLFSIARAGGPPLLAARLPVSRGQAVFRKRSAARKAVAVTLSELRATKQRGESTVTVPLFLGLSAVTLRKRFDVERVAESIVERLPGIYDRVFTPES